MAEGAATARHSTEQKNIHTLLNDYRLLCLKLFPDITEKKNISENLPEVTGNKIIHNDQIYYERNDIQGNDTPTSLFPNSHFFAEPITKLTHHKNSSTNSLCRYDSFSLSNTCFLPLDAVYHNRERNSNVTVDIIFNQQYLNKKMANFFDNNITNSVIAPFSNQLQNNISQKLYHHTIHLKQS